MKVQDQYNGYKIHLAMANMLWDAVQKDPRCKFRVEECEFKLNGWFVFNPENMHSIMYYASVLDTDNIPDVDHGDPESTWDFDSVLDCTVEEYYEQCAFVYEPRHMLMFTIFSLLRNKCTESFSIHSSDVFKFSTPKMAMFNENLSKYL